MAGIGKYKGKGEFKLKGYSPYDGSPFKMKKYGSPAKTHIPGHKTEKTIHPANITEAQKSQAKSDWKPAYEGGDYSREELLNQGFTQKDADQMIKSGATTGEVDKKPKNPKYKKSTVKESYKSRMKRLSKKYKKSPKEINKILKSKEYKEGRKSM